MIQHAIDGWVLEEMERDYATGIASFVYERGEDERRVEVRMQPSEPGHRGWNPSSKQDAVLPLLPGDLKRALQESVDYPY